MDNTNSPQSTLDLQAIFDTAVLEYQRKRESIMKTFISGIIELGGILSKYREQLKTTGKWMEYCDAIGTNISQANAQIRLFEYAQTMTSKEILGKVITNWAKLNLFLSLDDEEKEELLDDEDLSEDTNTDDFRSKVTKIKNIVEDEPVGEGITVDDILGEFQETEERTALKEENSSNPLFSNPEYAAEALQKEMKLGINTRTYLQARVMIEKAIELLQKPISITSDEKMHIKAMLQVQQEQLGEFLSK